MYKTIICQQCHSQFVWSEEEQKLYATRGIPAPEFCPICRGIMEAQSRDSRRARMENSRILNIEKKLDE